MAILESYLVSGPMANGDYDARCPLHKDAKRSCRINFETEKWICFAGCGSGGLAGLLKAMKEEGLVQEAGHQTRRLKRPAGRQAGSPVDPQDVERWHQELLTNSDRQDQLWRVREVRLPTIRRFKLGWDRVSQAFTIPIYVDGELFNVRKYRPNAPSHRKIWWHRKDDRPKPMFPESILLDTDAVLITEGEFDAMVANQHGFPAVSGTAGAGAWQVDWSRMFEGKQVYIVYDRDITGERGARQVAEALEPYAGTIYIAKIPLKKKGADVSDFFIDGHDDEEFRDMLRRAKSYEKRVTDPSKMVPTHVSVIDSFDSQNVGRALEMSVLVSGRGKDPYSIPKNVQATCTMDAGPKCKFCPMLQQHHGDLTYTVPAWSPHVLRMVGGTDQGMAEALRKTIGALKCDRLKHEVQTYQTVEQLYVRPSWDEESADFTPRKILSVGRHNTQPSQVINVTGTTWPDPKEQRNQFLAWQVHEADSAIDEFKVTPEVVRELRQFQPDANSSPLAKLGDIALDMEQHVTRIYGRLDLHAAVVLVYHSLMSFPFQGKVEERGWLDVLVMGDTRTGKSEAAKRLASHYRMGKVVNCEAASFAGIIGGLQQMGGSREWAVTWGAIPMNDRRLVILDEASGLSHEDIQKMSDARSSGYVLLQKIAQEQAWARTRLVWLSNPRSENMDHYTYGVQAITPLIGNREDIARFDFAMALTQHDVGMKRIQQAPSIIPPTFTSEACQQLVLWAWSRTTDDVEWVGEAERDVLIAAEWLSKRYVPEPPLLQKENARVKVARVAVALAATTFSTDGAGRKLLVKHEHVDGALRFLHGLYQKDTFGYARMSAQRFNRRTESEAGRAKAKRWLLENPNVTGMMRRMEGGQFRADMLERIANMDRSEANAAINRLFDFGLIYPDGQAMRMEPMLHQLIREIDEEEAG